MEKVLQEKIFEPLQMQNTLATFDNRQVLENLAEAYNWCDSANTFLKNQYIDNSIRITIYSTAGDLYKWASALTNSLLLSSASLQQMMANHLEKMKTLMIAFLLFYGNVDHSVNTLSKELTSKWMMHQVLEGEQNVTEQHNPNQDRYIWFKADGTFESGGTPYGKNSGKYELNAEAGTIFLDSDAGEGDDSHWRLKLEDEKLIVQGIGTPRQESFQLIFMKAEG